jgi:sporulation protein YlmC with PRC-barrel domain
METSVYWAALRLLDRQIVDREGRMAGNVDDLELTADADGRIHVSALLAGPGVLANRLGAKRFGRWLRRVHATIEGPPDEDPARIPIARVADIGDHITVSLRHEDMGTFHGERWTRDHLIGRIPGSGHEPPE